MYSFMRSVPLTSYLRDLCFSQNCEDFLLLFFQKFYIFSSLAFACDPFLCVMQAKGLSSFFFFLACGYSLVLASFVEKIRNSCFKLCCCLSVWDSLESRSLHFLAELGQEGGRRFVLSLGLVVRRSCTTVCLILTLSIKTSAESL